MNPSLRKAAILLSALDTGAADQLLEQMGEQQAARVRNAVVDLSDVDPGEQEAVLAEFFNRPVGSSSDGVELALTGAQPAVANRTEDLGLAVPRFEFLHHAGSAELAQRLRHEHPQLIAVVIANLAAERSAELLEHFPRQLREDVLERLREMEDADAHVIEELQQTLRRIFANSKHTPRRSGPLHNHWQAILGHLSRRVQHDDGSPIRQRTVSWKRYGEENSVETTAIRRGSHAAPLPPLNFDELLSLEAREFFAVFDEADPRVVMLALAGAPRRLFERYLAQFSTERALEYERHLEQMRPLRLHDVEAAQRELATLAGRRRQAARSAAEKPRRFAAAA
jgi:flagellar motor switch protein FliG